MINGFARQGIHALERHRADATKKVVQQAKVSLTQRADEFVNQGSKPARKKAEALEKVLTERVSSLIETTRAGIKKLSNSGEVSVATEKKAATSGEHILKNPGTYVKKDADITIQSLEASERRAGQKFEISGEKLFSEDEKLAILGKEELLNVRQIEKLDLHIPASEINELLKLEGDEFLLKTRDLLCKKLNVPAELYPTIIKDPSLKDALMVFSSEFNRIHINPPTLSMPKEQIMAALRHELQHQQQLFAILRCETLGEDAGRLFAQKRAEQGIALLDHNLRNLNSEQIKSIYPENFHEYLANLQKLLENGKTEEYLSAMKNEKTQTEEECLQLFQQIRKIVVDSLGTIKSNTPEERRAKKFFEYFRNPGIVFKQNGTRDQFNYVYQCAETEAFSAQKAMDFNILEAQGHKIEDKIKYIRMTEAEKAKKVLTEDQSELGRILRKIYDIIPHEIEISLNDKKTLIECMRIIKEHLTDSEYKLYMDYYKSMYSGMQEKGKEVTGKASEQLDNIVEYSTKAVKLQANRDEYIKKLMYLYL